MNFQSFPSREDLLAALTRDLHAALAKTLHDLIPSAIVLAGGRTPYPAYDAIAADPPKIGDKLWLSMSDERHVPRDSTQNNHHNATPLFRALKIPEENLLAAPTELPTAEATADMWDALWRVLVETNVRIPLLLLGLGADGHTAGLFNDDHLHAARGRLAVAVDRPDNRQGVSLTPDLFQRADRIILLAPGKDKQPRVEDLKQDPHSITAGKALALCQHVDVWS